MEAQEKKSKSHLLALEHKIGLLVFLLIAVIGIPVTVLAVKSSQDNRSLASTASEDPRSNLQLSTFDPSTYGKLVAIAHTADEIIVRYNSSVAIKTRFGVDQETKPFKIEDITSGLTSEGKTNLKDASVVSLEKVVKTQSSNSAEGKAYVANIYKLKVSPGSNLSAAMQTVCGGGTLTMYCEPNYTFTPAISFDPVQKAAAQEPNNKSYSSALIAIVDTPLAANYKEVASALELPAILAGNIISEGVAPRTDQYEHHSLFASASIFSINPNAKVIYVGACGQDCSNADLAKGIVDGVNNGAKVIYLGQSAPFPKGVTPMSIESAIDYAVVKGATVVAPVGNNSSSTSLNIFEKSISMVKTFLAKIGIHQAFAQTIPGALQSVINEKIKGADQQKIQNDIRSYLGSGVSRWDTQPNTSAIYIDNLSSKEQSAALIKEIVTAVLGKEPTNEQLKELDKNSRANDPTSSGERLDVSKLIQEAAKLNTSSPPPAAPPGTPTQPCGIAQVCTGPNDSDKKAGANVIAPVTFNQYVAGLEEKNRKYLENLQGYAKASPGGSSTTTGNSAAALALMYQAAGGKKISAAEMLDLLEKSRTSTNGPFDTQKAVENVLGFTPKQEAAPPQPPPPVQPPAVSPFETARKSATRGPAWTDEKGVHPGRTFEEIEGTEYKSDSEREFFFKQGGLGPPPPIAGAPPVAAPPAPGVGAPPVAAPPAPPARGIECLWGLIACAPENNSERRTTPGKDTTAAKERAAQEYINGSILNQERAAVGLPPLPNLIQPPNTGDGDLVPEENSAPQSPEGPAGTTLINPILDPASEALRNAGDLIGNIFGGGGSGEPAQSPPVELNNPFGDGTIPIPAELGGCDPTYGCAM